MFVPRAVNRKPATKPVRPKPPAQKSEFLDNSASQRDQVTTSSQGTAPRECEHAKLEDARSGDKPETTLHSFEKGSNTDLDKDSKLGDETATSCHSIQDGSGPSVAALEGSSTDLKTAKPLSEVSSFAKGDTTGLQAAADALQSATLKEEGNDCPTSDGESGVRSAISSRLPLDFAEIRRSVDKIKRDGVLQTASRDTKEDVAEGQGTKEAWRDEDEEDVEETNNPGHVGRPGVDQEEHEEVVSYSKNQRWPVGQEEPVCVVCGRYGAYICDQTEADICSRECKARNLARLGLTTGPQDFLTEDAQPETNVEDTPPVEDPVGYVYREHDDISDLSREQVQEIRARVDIFVEGVDVPRPIVEFSHLAAPHKMESNLASVGYDVPTPVQMQVIPAALRWRDAIVCAQTSSGKTAAFLVPTILQIYNTVCFRDRADDGGGPLGLILSPSRELAMQIEEQAKQLMQGLPNMRTALVVGGLPLPTQLHRLEQDIQLVIATPGRILDVISRQGVSLAAVKTVIIDEVDTMLHKGFKQQVMEVVGHLPDSHQTMLFSATIPPSIEKLASSLLHNPLYVSVGKPNTPCTSVKQIVMWVEEPAKKKNLFAILQDPKHYKPPLVVFVDSKMGAGLLSLAIHKMCDIRAASLHGDRPQTERTETLRAFREAEYPVLICTAVLGRGIDLPGVRMVVNFDMPNTVEEYIHQIGRTGRLGSKGTAITFINNSSKNLFLEFVNTLRPLGVPLPPQLANSAHLRYQQQGHRSWHGRREGRRNEESQDVAHHGNASYFGYKRRKQESSTVGELLKKRKHKKEPR